MTILDVKPNESGIKRRCAEIAVLLTLKHSGPMKESELKQESAKRNYDESLVFSNTSRKEQIPRTFNHIISKALSRGYVEKKDGDYCITESGVERVESLYRETVNILKQD